MAIAKITFGLGPVVFPASLDKATETAVELRNLCVGSNGHDAHDPKPLTAPRKCEDCGEITDYAGVVKGIKQGSSYAIVEQEKVAEARQTNDAQFKGRVNLVPHPRADFEAHTAQGKSLYYVTPDPAAANQYAALVELIGNHPELSFVTLYTPRTAAAVYQVVVRDGALMLEERTRGQAMKPAPTPVGMADPQMVQMLDMFLSNLIQPYEPDAYADKYAAAVALLAAEAKDVVTLGSDAAKPAPVAAVADSDLMAKLAALTQVA